MNQFECRQFYIDGRWVDPVDPRTFETVNPAAEQASGLVHLGSAADVDRPVAAARAAFDDYSRTSREDRKFLLQRILEEYQARIDDVARAISVEMGAPVTLAHGSQAQAGIGHLAAMIEVLERFSFEERHAKHSISYEPVGVCALITPWNWPINQVAAKVVPALAAGCTMVLKPSEFAPFSATIWAEVLHAAGVPHGVFNLVHGDGVGVGAPLAAHPDVDMVSFTGSTRAGREIARAAAVTVKRVHQELGGKSPNIVLDDADIEQAVTAGVLHLVDNSGQSCNAPTRMLVPAARLAEVERIAKRVAESVIVGDPASPDTKIGPVVSRGQFERVQGYIEQGIAEGAALVTGGPGRPRHLERGYYVRPTVFSNVSNDMTIAREEIFGPVLCLLPYSTDEEAVRIANDTPYGLAAYVWGKDERRRRDVASRLRAGRVVINGASGDMHTPFGGFKQSGNGREWGEHGLRDFLEVKAIVGD